jgi:hypothetical protein
MLKLFHRNKLADWQRWGLAAGGALTQWNQGTFERLAFGEAGAASRRGLSEWWDVDSPSDLDVILNWLYDEGHNARCLALCDEIRSLDYTDPTTDEDEPEARAFYRFLLKEHAYFEDKEMVGWDLSRLVNVARWGYNSKYITADDAWEWIRLASQGLQDAFESWLDMGVNFLMGYRYWSNGGEIPSALLAAHHWLASSKDSPWQKIEWDTALDDVDPAESA